MMDHFVYDGVDSRDFGIYVYDLDTFGGSAREYESNDIPGKSGSVLIDGKRYPNRIHSYSCIIKDDCVRNLDSFRAFLLSRVGYCRLEDSLHLDEFYSAVYRDEFVPILSRDRKMAKFELAFERKPQRWLKSGEISIRLDGDVLAEDGVNILNPTRFPAYPLLIVHGTTQIIRWGEDEKITVFSSQSRNIYVDCESMEAYLADSDGNPTQSMNYDVEFLHNDFPYLPVGETNIRYASGTDGENKYILMYPRWFTM